MATWTVQSGTLNTNIEAETPKEAVYSALKLATGNLGLIVEVRVAGTDEGNNDALYFHTMNALAELGLLAEDQEII
jgi:hypothetical protein